MFRPRGKWATLFRYNCGLLGLVTHPPAPAHHHACLPAFLPRRSFDLSLSNPKFGDAAAGRAGRRRRRLARTQAGSRASGRFVARWCRAAEHAVLGGPEIDEHMP
ncbi:hypothetical protein U9M48_026647 [Paspalum notatum var. saurae]|uniref:Uncharacterized protein n=1 Tax=Paspalum notatum var. saurae TaxID=547442 RepID=A0AAQ3TRC2_PASNO